jgi:hypothetical protein
MYRAHLYGGPLDGQVFKVPMVKPTLHVARYDPGPFVIIDPTTCEPVTEIHTYIRQESVNSDYRYLYRGLLADV